MFHQFSDAGERKKPSLLRRAEWFGLSLLLICVAGIAWSGWYDGKTVPDPSTDSDLRVLTTQMRDRTSLAADPDRAQIRAGTLQPVGTRWLWTGTQRTFIVYLSSQTATSSDVDAAIADGFANLKKWERRRGQLLLASEQPAQVGTILFLEATPRRFTQFGWTHLNHLYDPSRLLLAIFVGCLALLAYVAIRLVCVLLAAAYAYVATGAVPQWAAGFGEDETVSNESAGSY